MDTIQITQSVAILCDGNNIERSIHEQSQSTHTMVNFDDLIPKLLNGRGLNRLIYFREGKAISTKFADRLHENFYGAVIPCHKSADIPLSIKATQLSSKVDTIIIMSGDSDFVELVRHLKAEGVRVEIAAVKTTTAKILIEESAYYESLHETPLIANTIARKKLFEMNRIISDTAEYGCYLFDHAAKPMLTEFMKKIDTDVIGKKFSSDNSVDNKTLIAVNDAIRNHPVEEVGAWLRESMTAMKEVKTSQEAVTA